MTVEEILKIVEIAGLKSGELKTLSSSISRMVKKDEIIKVKFPNMNKSNTLESNNKEMDGEYGYVINSCRVVSEHIISGKEYDDISVTLLQDRPEYFEGLGGWSLDDKYLEGIEEGSDRYYQAWKNHGITAVVRMTDGTREFYVNPEGYSYARYVGVKA